MDFLQFHLLLLVQIEVKKLPLPRIGLIRYSSPHVMVTNHTLLTNPIEITFRDELAVQLDRREHDLPTLTIVIILHGLHIVL